MKYIVVNITKVVITLLLTLITLQDTVYAEIINPDEWEWELIEVQPGHVVPPSTETLKYLKVTPDVSNFSNGTITVESIGYIEGENHCMNTYTFKWEILSPVELLELSDELNVEVKASGTGTGTVLPEGQCDGSPDGAMTSGGTKGNFPRPEFLRPIEAWNDVTTDNGIGPAAAFGNHGIPQNDDGKITFNLRYGPNYPEYASFVVNVVVGSTLAPNIQISYSAVYIYKRVRKQVVDNRELLWLTYYILSSKAKK